MVVPAWDDPRTSCVAACNMGDGALPHNRETRRVGTILASALRLVRRGGGRGPSFSTAMPESSLRFRLVIARAPDSTPGDVSGIATRLQTDTELFWLLGIARPVAAAPKVCRRSVATCLAVLMLDDHLRVLRVLPGASVPHTPATGVLRKDGVIQTYLGGVLPPRALADTKRIAELLIDGHAVYLDTLCRALSGDDTPAGFEAVPLDHELYDAEAEQYFAPPPPFQEVRRAGNLPATGGHGHDG